MKDIRSGITYLIYGIEDQFLDAWALPMRIMGYIYTFYVAWIKERKAYSYGNDIGIPDYRACYKISDHANEF